MGGFDVSEISGESDDGVLSNLMEQKDSSPTSKKSERSSESLSRSGSRASERTGKSGEKSRRRKSKIKQDPSEKSKNNERSRESRNKGRNGNVSERFDKGEKSRRQHEKGKKDAIKRSTECEKRSKSRTKSRSRSKSCVSERRPKDEKKDDAARSDGKKNKNGQGRSRKRHRSRVGEKVEEEKVVEEHTQSRITLSTMPDPSDDSSDESAVDEPAARKVRDPGVKSSFLAVLEIANILRKADENKKRIVRGETKQQKRQLSIKAIARAVRNDSAIDDDQTQKSTRSITATAPLCRDCNAELKKGRFGLRETSTSCTNCEETLCLKCARDQALIPFKEYDDNPLPLKKSSIKCYCKACFGQVSILDYTKSHDIIFPNQNKKNITLVWVHGGGASRALFRPHASALARMGYTSILLDLPGHGTQVDKRLTLESCVGTVRYILNRRCGKVKEGKPSRIIYVGASLGAYIGFYILEKLNDRFAGAVLLNCGQNVGPDCGRKSKAGIWLLRKLSGNLTNKTSMGAMMSLLNRSNADYHIGECNFAGGMFFQQGSAWCDCMDTVAPADIIPTLDIPILFFNGSKDYRDSENKWLSRCRDYEKSSLKVFDGGNHFFCHDSRFVDDMLQHIDVFIQGIGLDILGQHRSTRHGREYRRRT
mmetsp:Transcript_13391/g.23984  ORF Transcript_13391/g.23984 Transcript_13391/m.23984 type:complete len:651 (+) Transcript_13391:93-2045(+)|eukprot:CAMPEP_0196144582 /NCGR_PEP_ID=MMETSP0910-20130528/17039_1 /TAXON_ID=49265 /ORGANISM="Thalassiosira rotula, Strain GSO102" /LENGTH=650 /DNA_ID=CAMNT_0041406277 /DNA_START=44 /DNA_END=1996 /DNA_ORIENTATION=+